MSYRHAISLLVRNLQLALSWVLPGLLLLTSLHVAANQAVAVGKGAQALPELRQLNSLSQQLIGKIKAGTAEAVAFRTDVVFYRESLRNLMLKNEKPGPQRLSKPLLMKMVRMAALLQSAAECHTGRYISCPANLMHELEQQQKQLNRMVTVVTNRT